MKQYAIGIDLPGNAPVRVVVKAAWKCMPRQALL